MIITVEMGAFSQARSFFEPRKLGYGALLIFLASSVLLSLYLWKQSEIRILDSCGFN